MLPLPAGRTTDYLSGCIFTWYTEIQIKTINVALV